MVFHWSTIARFPVSGNRGLASGSDAVSAPLLRANPFRGCRFRQKDRPIGRRPALPFAPDPAHRRSTMILQNRWRSTSTR